jgi:YbbR domain-containing protein
MPLPPSLRRLRTLSLGEGIKGLLTRNLPMKAASLCLALVLWAFVQQGQIVEQTVFAQVSYSWPTDLVVAKPPPSRVHMTLAGSRANMRRIDNEAMKVVVDMSEATEGVQSIDYALGAIAGLPAGVKVLGTRPSSAQLALEPRTERRLPVEVAQVGNVDDGLRLHSIVVEPAEVTVFGPASVVETMESIHTEGVSLVGVSGEWIQNVAINLNSSKSLEVDPESVQVIIRVESESEERTVAGISVVVNAVDWLSVTSQAQVVFSGPRESMEQLNEANLFVILEGPTDLPDAVNSISLSRLPNADYRYRVVRPTGVKVLRVEPETFELVRRN